MLAVISSKEAKESILQKIQQKISYLESVKIQKINSFVERKTRKNKFWCRFIPFSKILSREEIIEISKKTIVSHATGGPCGISTSRSIEYNSMLFGVIENIDDLKCQRDFVVNSIDCELGIVLEQEDLQMLDLQPYPTSTAFSSK